MFASHLLRQRRSVGCGEHSQYAKIDNRRPYLALSAYWGAAMFKTRELEAFDAYMRLGGVKMAAEDLDTSQPMVSRLLSALEEKTGFELFL
ncbi:MAG: helix-turn-helix domain-containing protein, partial [Pseudooceanicola nanhaiensis]